MIFPKDRALSLSCFFSLSCTHKSDITSVGHYLLVITAPNRWICWAYRRWWNTALPGGEKPCGLLLHLSNKSLYHFFFCEHIQWWDLYLKCLKYMPIHCSQRAWLGGDLTNQNAEIMCRCCYLPFFPTAMTCLLRNTLKQGKKDLFN